uniref:Odorant receptor n=1 Tax=Anopheles coluzzii TaxID=1518534 RepID=A0A8W7NZN0_ANOCL
MYTAIEFYNASFNRLKLSSRLIGAGLWEKQEGILWGRVASVMQIVLFLTLHAWTGYKYRYDALQMLETQSLICTGAALMIKYFTMIRNPAPVRELSGNIETQMYTMYQEMSPEYPVVLKYGRVLYIAGHIMIGGYFGSLFIIWINPLIMYFKEGRVMLLFFCEIPYVDWTVMKGYWTTLYVKFIIGHKKASELKLLSDNIEQAILQRYENGKAEEIAVLQRTGRILWFIFRFMRTSVSSAAFGFFLYPVIAYYTTGELMPLFMIELPYYGWTTTIGLAMNMFCQANILVIGTMGAIMSDFLFFMYAMYAMTCIDIFIVHLCELETLLKEIHIHEKDCAKQTSIMRQKWIQCMQDHQQATRCVCMDLSYESLMLFQLIFLIIFL